MRYIGSKGALLSNIGQIVQQNANDDAKVFCDIFAGSGTVGRAFKPQYEIISNDLMYFSYVLQRASIGINEVPTFESLMPGGAVAVLDWLNNMEPMRDDSEHFILRNYSPASTAQRMYFTESNARKIDDIRITIENWHNERKLNSDEYFYLLASLIEAVPFVSNTTGTYGAYLKKWDSRAHKRLMLEPLQLIDNGVRNHCYNSDANQLIREIEGDILYIDPPYNERQYAPNYHLLETIARYDNPDITGVTGMRPYSDQKSDYCSKKSVYRALYELIEEAKFKSIVLSYSSDGILAADEILEIYSRFCTKESIKKIDISYRKYKSRIYNNDGVSEYLFCGNKE